MSSIGKQHRNLYVVYIGDCRPSAPASLSRRAVQGGDCGPSASERGSDIFNYCLTAKGMSGSSNVKRQRRGGNETRYGFGSPITSEAGRH